MLWANTSGTASASVSTASGGPWESPAQRLDGDARPQPPQPPHRAADVVGAAVEEVVAVDHGHDHVLEIEPGDGARHVLRLAHVDGAARIARGHRAEAAAPGAHVAEEHHGGGA